MSPLLKLARFGQYAGLIWMMAALPLANWLMSVGIIIMACSWVLLTASDYLERKEPWARWYTFRHTPGALRYGLLYLVFAVSIFWTADLAYGLKDMKTKLPILALPVILSGFDPVNGKWIRRLWMTFIASLILAVTVCLMVYYDAYNAWAVPLGFRPREVNNFRDISIFISHIRFSLLLVMGLAVLVCLKPRTWKLRLLFTLTGAYFLFFLWVIESVTAFAIISVLAGAWLMWQMVRTKRMALKAILIALPVIVVAGTAWWVVDAYQDYYSHEPVTVEQLDTHTPYGEAYEHYPEHGQIENGQYTMIYLAWGEMAAAWEQRSEIPFEGQDRAGHSIKGTLIRYLTSKGLRKDRNGLNALTEQDIRNIENGVASAVLMKHKGIRRRLDRILFEYESFRTGQNPNGHSVFQRIEFWKAGSGIISNNFWWGVGIGDVKRAFADQYNVMNSPLDEVHRLRAHNQWMTVWITSGLSGFLVFVLAWFTLFRRSSHARTMLFTAFFIIASLSFVTEDTLESQAGVSFFAFIGSVILFLPKRP